MKEKDKGLWAYLFVKCQNIRLFTFDYFKFYKTNRDNVKKNFTFAFF